MAFRDDREALREQNQALERELESTKTDLGEARRELARLQSGRESELESVKLTLNDDYRRAREAALRTAEELRQVQAALEEAQAENSSLKRRLEEERPKRTEPQLFQTTQENLTGDEKAEQARAAHGAIVMNRQRETRADFERMWERADQRKNSGEPRWEDRLPLWLLLVIAVVGAIMVAALRS